MKSFNVPPTMATAVGLIGSARALAGVLACIGGGLLRHIHLIVIGVEL